MLGYVYFARIVEGMEIRLYTFPEFACNNPGWLLGTVLVVVTKISSVCRESNPGHIISILTNLPELHVSTGTVFVTFSALLTVEIRR